MVDYVLREQTLKINKSAGPVLIPGVLLPRIAKEGFHRHQHSVV